MDDDEPRDERVEHYTFYALVDPSFFMALLK